MKQATWAIPFAVALASGAFVLGCPGKLADKECFVQERDAHKILLGSCTGASCHNAKDHTSKLDLETPNVGSRLSGTTSATCQGVLIAPGDPDRSILYGKLAEPVVCGSRMPLGL